MGLSDSKVGAAIAVTDVDRAVEFYGGKLGLRSNGGAEPDGGRTCQCGSGSTLHVFPLPTPAPRAPRPQASCSMTSRARSTSCSPESARVRGLTVHEAGRICATLLVDLDVHLRLIMRILRPADAWATMEVCARASSGATREAWRRLGESSR